MPEHVLQEGRRVIEALAALGRALGYTTEPERAIGPSGAAVDLAWYAARDHTVPLFIFEVESRPTSGMANNAVKVFGRDSEDFVKPLFFFHVLLSGGQDNDRIAGLRRAWGTYNYRLYRLNEKVELARLVRDILSQHRRINRSIEVADVLTALSSPPWGDPEISAALDSMEGLGFEANFLGDYGYLGIKDSRFRPPFLGRLARVLQGGRLECEGYRTYLGEHFSAMIELALLVRSGHASQKEAISLLRTADYSPGVGFRMLPLVGRNREYDEFIIGISPFTYAVCALITRDFFPIYLRLVSDLRLLLSAQRKLGLVPQYLLPGALWLAHLSSAGLSRPAGNSSARSLQALRGAFGSARKIVDSANGVPESVLDCPPSSIDLMEPGEWLDRLNGPGIAMPAPEMLYDRYLNTEVGLWSDVPGATLLLLLSDDWPTWSTSSLVAALYR